MGRARQIASAENMDRILLDASAASTDEGEHLLLDASAAATDVGFFFNTEIGTTETPPEGFVIESSLAANAVTNSKVADDAVTVSKLDSTSQSLSNRNLVINGAMNVAQRGTSSTGVGASTGYFTCDRWLIAQSGDGRLTMSQDSSVPTGKGFANSIKLDCTTADTSIAASEFLQIVQKIEGQNLQSIAKGTSDAKQITVSFYVKANAPFNFVCELNDLDNTRHISKLFATTTDWVKHEITFPADTTGAFDNDNAASLNLTFWLHAGSTYSGGTLNTASFASTTNANRAAGVSSFYSSTDNNFFITGVQLEIGSEATEFEHEPMSQTEIRCYRYTQRLPHRDNTSGTGYANVTTMGRNDSTTVSTTGIMLPVVMRADATMSSSGNFRVHHANAAEAVTGLAIDDNFSTAGNLGINATVSSGLTAGEGSQLEQNNDVDAHLILSAEL